MNLRILNLADTPVAGTVERMTAHINAASGMECRSLIRRNYSHNAFTLMHGALNALDDWQMVVSQGMRWADVVLVQNSVDAEFMGLLFAMREPKHRFIYQYHSAPAEPPLFTYDSFLDFSFDHILSVAQGHGRFHAGAIPMANIIADCHFPFTVIRQPHLFIPHLRSTAMRWSNKVSPDDVALITRMMERSGIRVKRINDLFGRESVTHQELLQLLPTMRFIVDDIHTGLFHQTALEGIKAGCVVFSAADPIAIEEFCVAADCPPPPFVYADGPEMVIEEIYRLNRDGLWRTHSDMATHYGQTYLSESRLGARYALRLKEISGH